MSAVSAARCQVHDLPMSHLCLSHGLLVCTKCSTSCTWASAVASQGKCEIMSYDQCGIAWQQSMTHLRTSLMAYQQTISTIDNELSSLSWSYNAVSGQLSSYFDGLRHAIDERYKILSAELHHTFAQRQHHLTLQRSSSSIIVSQVNNVVSNAERCVPSPFPSTSSSLSSLSSPLSLQFERFAPLLSSMITLSRSVSSPSASASSTLTTRMSSDSNISLQVDYRLISTIATCGKITWCTPKDTSTHVSLSAHTTETTTPTTTTTTTTTAGIASPNSSTKLLSQSQSSISTPAAPPSISSVSAATVAATPISAVVTASSPSSLSSSADDIARWRTMMTMMSGSQRSLEIKSDERNDIKGAIKPQPVPVAVTLAAMAASYDKSDSSRDQYGDANMSRMMAGLSPPACVSPTTPTNSSSVASSSASLPSRSNESKSMMGSIEGKLVRRFGNEGNGDGQMDTPFGLATDDNTGYIYCGDLSNYRINVTYPHLPLVLL
jgi:hypothetical protein